MKVWKFFVPVSVLLSSLSSIYAGNFDFKFNPENNPLDTFKVYKPYLESIGKQIIFDGTQLKTLKSNSIFYIEQEFSTGSIRWISQLVWKNSKPILMGRFNPLTGDNYSLMLEPEKKKAIFSRRIAAKQQTLAISEIDPGHGNVKLELLFDGKKIVAQINDKTIALVDDDGKLSKGLPAIGTTWYANVKPLEFTVEDTVPVISAPKSVPVQKNSSKSAAAYKLSRTMKFDMKKLDWDLDNAWTKANGSRKKISLCGLWQFAPVSSKDKAMPTDPNEWGYFAVPGFWKNGENSDYMHLADGRALSEWNGKAIQKYPAVWYKRSFNIPAAIAEARLELYFEHIRGAYDMYLNGRKIFSQKNDENASRRIEVTSLVKAERKNEIALFIKTEERGGLSGRIWLKALPKENLGWPEITTSVSNKNITLTFSENNAPTDASLSISIRDAVNGKQVYSRTLPFGNKRIIPWIADKLWSPDSPNLYFMDFILKGKDGRILDQFSQRFGFREFKVAGGKYLLNGKPVNLKLDTSVETRWSPNWHNDKNFMRRKIAMRKAINLNAMYVSDDMTDELPAIADEMGMMLIPKINILSHRDMDLATDQTFKEIKSYLTNEKLSGRFSNHPSLIGCLIDVWFNFHDGTKNPAYVGLDSRASSYKGFNSKANIVERQGKDPNLVGIPAKRKVILEKIRQVYNAVFPELEVFTGGSGQVGDIYACHVYHTWGAPLAELRTFFLRWSLQQDIPVFIGESTQPYVGAFYKLDSRWKMPLFAENAARFIGNKAYTYKIPYTQRPFHDRTRNGFFWSTSEGKNSKEGAYLFPSNVYTDILDYYLGEIMMPWRIQGVSGIGTFNYENYAFAGQYPDYSKQEHPDDFSVPEYKPGRLTHGNAKMPLFDIKSKDLDLRPAMISSRFKRVMNDFSFAIVGPEEDIYLEDHAFYSGETIKKNTYIINDTAKTRELTVSCSLLNSIGNIVADHKQHLKMKAYSRKALPFSFVAPEVVKRENFRFCVTVAGFASENVAMKDYFKFQVFPKSRPLKLKHKLSVYDPEGTLCKILKNSEIAFESIGSLASLPKLGTLIVGRKALRMAEYLPSFIEATECGLNILVMEQDIESSVELMKVRARTAFINAAAHPALAGFKNEDFSNWRGSHAIMSPYKDKVPPNENWTDWGNRNMLASYTFRRPPHGNYIALLVSGFDLFQSPLLEYRSSAGSMIMSQLEISERIGSDPVASGLFENLLYYLDRRGMNKTKSLYFAGEEGEKWIQRMQVKAERIARIDAKKIAGADTLIICDPDWKELREKRFAINDFVYWGGILIYIQKGKEFDPSWLPFTMKLKSVDARKALLSRTAPDFIWNNGWDNNDLYWYNEYKIPVFDAYPAEFDHTEPAVLLRLKSGHGEFIFLSVTPELFKNDPAAAKTSRLISALLTSAGTGLVNHSNIFHRNENEAKLDLSELAWEFTTDPDDKGLKENWQSGKGNARWLKGLIADGVEVRVGQYFETFLRKNYDGYVWYRLNFDLPGNLQKETQLYFIAGAIDDFDEVYINGKLIGKTDRSTPRWWEHMRCYKIPQGLLNAGSNLIVLRVLDEKGMGGISKLPLMISNEIPKVQRGWESPYLKASDRDYNYKADIIKMF